MLRFSAQKSFEEALARAQKRSTLLCVHFFAPWCQYSNLWRQEVLQSEFLKPLLQEFEILEWNRDLVAEWDESAQTLVQLQGLAGGWPLNLFLTPQGFPLLACTSLKLEGFQNLLNQLLQAFQLDGPLIQEKAQQFYKRSIDQDLLQARDLAPQILEDGTLIYQRLLMPIQQSLQAETGWIGHQDFFLFPKIYSFLLQNEESQLLGQLSLSALSKSLLNDVISGGFFRHASVSSATPTELSVSTEKLGVENAELLETYALAWKKTHSVYFAQMVSELANSLYTHWGLRSAQGFGSSLSASPLFYKVYAENLLELAPELRLPAQFFFGVDTRSPVPHIKTTLAQLASQLETPPADLQKKLFETQKLLGELRNKKDPSLHPEILPRTLYTEAKIVTAILVAASHFESSPEWEERVDFCFACLESWNQENVTEWALDTPRTKWAALRAFLAPTLYELRTSSDTNPLSEKLLNAALIELKLDSGWTELHTKTPFLGKRFDFKDHLGSSAAAERLETWIDFYEVLHLQKKPLSERAFCLKTIEDMLGPLLYSVRNMGIHAAAIYSAWSRWKELPK